MKNSKTYRNEGFLLSNWQFAVVVVVVVIVVVVVVVVGPGH